MGVVSLVVWLGGLLSEMVGRWCGGCWSCCVVGWGGGCVRWVEQWCVGVVGPVGWWISQVGV